MKSLLRLSIVALALTLVLTTACGGGSPDETPAAEAPEAEAVAGTSAASATEAASAGAGGEPIKVGAVSTLSGPAAFPDTTAAAQAVFDQVNDQGGIEGRPIEYLVEDDKADPAAAAQAARLLVDEEQVVANVGSTSLLECGVNAQLYAERGLLSLEGPSANPACFGSANIIPIQAGLFGSTRLMLDFAANELGKQRICVLLHNLQGTAPGYEAAIGAFEASTGIELAYDERNLGVTDDPTPYLVQAKNADCEALVFSGAPPQVIAIVQAARAQGITPDTMALLTLVPAYNEDVAQALGDAGEGLYANTDFVPWSDPDDPALADWTTLMDAAGVPKTSFSQAGYLNGRAFVEALRGVDGEINRESVTQAIGSLTEFVDPMLGVPLSFAPADAHEPPLVMRAVQLQGGQWEVASDFITLEG